MTDKLTATDYKKRMAREHRKKELGYRSYLKKMFEILGDKWRAGFAGLTKDGKWARDPDDAEFYERYWRGKRSKNIKQQCNRKLRRTNKDKIYQNGEYKKATEFWWELD